MTVESCLVKLYVLRPEVRDPVPEAEGRRLEANDQGLVAEAECYVQSKNLLRDLVDRFCQRLWQIFNKLVKYVGFSGYMRYM